MKIATIINRKGQNIESVKESDPLESAVEVMHRKAIGSVVVRESRTREIIGILSEAEVIAATGARGKNALKLPVLLYTRRPAVFCACQDDAATVMRLMTRERCRHIVVCSVSGSIAGVVSLGDLVAALLEEAQLEASVLRDMARSRLLAMPG